MNERESKVAKKYETAGWRVLRGGAPDFLMIKVEGAKPAIRLVDGKISGVKAVEVKSETDPGSTHVESCIRGNVVMSNLGTTMSRVE